MGLKRKMKKISLYALLLLLISGCDSAEEKAFNNCVDDMKNRQYEGKIINEFAAGFLCQEIKKEMPDMFRRSKGKIFDYLKSAK